MIEPALADATMSAKYAALARFIQSALGRFQISTQTGAAPGAYCPGASDIAVGGRKIAGMSQHWFRNRHGLRCVVTAASINVDESPHLLASVNRFYRAAGSNARCDSTALTSLRLCGGSAPSCDPDLVPIFMREIASDVS